MHIMLLSVGMCMVTSGLFYDCVLKQEALHAIAFRLCRIYEAHSICYIHPEADKQEI